MEGILLIDKPIKMTSYQVIRLIKKKLLVKKIGHAGTLDPLASGLLVIMVGRSATKLSNQIMSQSKAYDVQMELFSETETGDKEGKIILKEKARKIKLERIKDSLQAFSGLEYNQLPPMYSAIKVNGKKMYEYARKGEKIEIKPRKVFIKSIEFKKYEENENAALISFSVECSKGTYIRSLVVDIAKKLDTIAHLASLKRTKSGNFRLDESTKLEILLKKDIPSIEKKVIKINELVRSD